MKHVAHQLRGQLHVCQGGSGFIVRVRASYFATTAVLLGDPERSLEWGSGDLTRAGHMNVPSVAAAAAASFACWLGDVW